MSTGYVPNEKRLKMFGAQPQGYSMDRVDMYLDKLEGAYTQLRTAYEQVKSAAEQPAPPAAPAANPAQVQELLAINARLQQDSGALQQENEILRAKVSEVEARVAQQLSAANQQLQQPRNEGAIARALLSAQEKAEEILRGAQLEAQGIVANAHNQVEHLQVEKARARKQLEGIRFALEGLLREPAQDTNYGSVL
ncbi:MAG: DivIVA domain-containing protein [Oscillospiraceae bacterium]|jgi:cell division septum initiation protein DivIVA|nr:DivIVA domain-containing protein [Oscillospiraceae bacterium]